MKILYILSQQPGNTGSGVYLKWITRGAIKSSHNIRIVIGVNKDFNYMDELPHIAPDKIYPVCFETEKLPFSVAGMSDIMPYKSTKFKDFSNEMLKKYSESFLERFYEIKKTWIPDIIHSNHLWIVSSLVKKVFLHTPLVVSCHGTALRQKELCPAIWEKIKPQLKKIDKILALTRHQKEEIINSLQIEDDKVVVTGTAYPDDIFYCNVKKTNKKNFIISYAGKISYAKGVPYLIEAFRKLKSISPLSLKLYLAGGYESFEGKGIVSSVNDPDISFLGNLNQSDLAKLFRKSDLFVLPSFFEGLPLVVFEALACGCNVIVTEIENIKNWLECDDLIKLNALKFIPLPKMRTIDVPHESETDKFINSIMDAILYFVNLKKRGIYPDIIKITNYISNHSFRELFKKLEKIYNNLTNNHHPDNNN